MFRFSFDMIFKIILPFYSVFVSYCNMFDCVWFLKDANYVAKL